MDSATIHATAILEKNAEDLVRVTILNQDAFLIRTLVKVIARTA